MRFGAGQIVAGRDALILHLNSPAAYPPLMHLMRVLLDDGWSLKLMGAAGVDGLAVPVALSDRIGYMDLGRRTGHARAGFLMRLVVAVLKTAWQRPRVLIASDPDSAGPALILAALLGLPIVYLEHDSPCPDPRRDRGVLRRSLRRLLLSHAALRVFPNWGRLAFAQGENGFSLHDSVVMPNLPVTEAVPSEIKKRSYRCLHFHGSISPWALPLALVPALVQRPDWCMDIYGYAIGHQEHLDDLLRAANAAGIGERLRFHGAQPNSALHGFLTNADAAFAGFRPYPFNLNHTLIDGASNKLNEYAWHGLPTLVPDDVPLDGFPDALTIRYSRNDSNSMVSALDAAMEKKIDLRWRPKDFLTVCRERVLPRLNALVVR